MDDDLEKIFRILEELETLSLSEAVEITDPLNINAYLEPVPSRFQEQPSEIAEEVLHNLQDLDHLMPSSMMYGPDTVYTPDQSIRFGTNKRSIGSSVEIAAYPNQQLFSSILNQSYVGETSNSINSASIQHGESLSQVQFPNVEDSIQFKPIDSSIDIAAANQQLPRKRRRKSGFVKDRDQI